MVNIANRFHFPPSEIEKMKKNELEYWSEMADKISEAEAKAAKNGK